MRHIVLLAALCTMAQCSSPGYSRPAYYNEYDYSRHYGKTIRSVTQNDLAGESQYNITIHFTDGTSMSVIANKYTFNVR